MIVLPLPLLPCPSNRILFLYKYPPRFASKLPSWSSAQGLIFRCVACNHTLHSDLVGARNITLRTLLLRQDFESTGRISAIPDVSHEETKAKYLPRFLELRWSADTIPN